MSGRFPVPFWKDPDFAERLHKFEVVCKVVNQLRRAGRVTVSLHDLRKEFGLTAPQCQYCIGRARNFISEMNDLSRERARRGELTNSDEMLAWLRQRKKK